MKIENIINYNGNRAVNQFAVYHGDYIYFQSYETMIARYNRRSGELVITESWDCSVTTRKHFYIFLRYYTPFTPTRKNVLNHIKDGFFKVVDEKTISL